MKPFLGLFVCFGFLGGCAEAPAPEIPIKKPTSNDKKPETTLNAADTGDKGKIEKVVIETSMGTIKLDLYPDKAPDTVKNFLGYVGDKFYDGTIFHRVIGTFMIQGGGFEPGMKEREIKDPIKNEANNGLANNRGTIAMARTPDPHSATAQFFINVADNSNLNHRDKSRRGYGYCVFGKVTDGMDVVDKIKVVKTKAVRVPGNPEPMTDVPVDDVTIKSIRRVD